MTNWTAIAHARDLDIPPAALEALSTALDGLEQSFRPLTARLPFTLEPATILSESAVVPQTEPGK
jgi:hypothetical protein